MLIPRLEYCFQTDLLKMVIPPAHAEILCAIEQFVHVYNTQHKSGDIDRKLKDHRSRV